MYLVGCQGRVCHRDGYSGDAFVVAGIADGVDIVEAADVNVVVRVI